MTVPRVHIKGLGESGDKEEIRDLFGKFGPLKNVWIATKPPGFAYVFFQTFEDAEKAVDYYNGKKVCGMTVRVELSPIEDKMRFRQPLPRRLEPVERKKDDETRSFSDESDKYYDSDEDAKRDYERERRHEKGDYRDRNPREGYQSRGRPYQRGGSRGYSSSYRGQSDERRHSYPDRRGSFGRGRGWSDHRDRYEDGYRPRGRGRGDYHGGSFRGRGRDRGGAPDRYYSGQDRGDRGDRGGGFRPREFHRQDQYSSSGRGRSYYQEKPYFERSRSNSGRYSPPPPSRHPSDYSPHKRRLGPPVDSEYVAKQYRMKHVKNGRGETDFGGSSRSGESRRHDMEYRHSRRMTKEEMYDPRERDYIQEKESRHPHPSKRHAEHRSHHKEYIGSKYWKSEELRSRSPLSPSKEYGSPPRRYRYPDGSPSSSRSRSRSVSSQTSDTSRGPSASPSPPRHKNRYRTPSRSLSRSASPLPEVYAGGKYSHPQSPQEDARYRSPSPEYLETSKFSSPPPPPPPPLPPYDRRSSPTYASNSPAYVMSPKHGDRFESEKEMEYERAKKQHEYKKMKREVRDRDRDRQIVYQEKPNKNRYIELDTRTIQERDDKRQHTRPLSESFDMIGSSHSSGNSSPPPQRRPHGDLKRKRSSHKEEYVV